VETVAFLDYLGGNRSLVYLPQPRRQPYTHLHNPEPPEKFHIKIPQNHGLKTVHFGLKTAPFWNLKLIFGAQPRMPARSIL
jgi:hypothetical protein